MNPASRRVLIGSCAVLGAAAWGLGSTRESGADRDSRQPGASEPARPADTLWNARGCVDDERGRWFRDAKFGAFIHFGLYSQLGGYYDGKGPYRPSEQIIGLGERRAAIPASEYRAKVGGAFNPTRFDAARWVGLMKKAGQKYVIATAKHHDGFCMFKTATTSYNVVEATPFGRDFIGELADECRKQGLEFCPYFSIGDWCAAEVQKPGFAGYPEYMRAQIRELLTGYGGVRMIWFDNWWYVNDQWQNDEAHARDLYAFVRSINPNVLVNDRCGRGAASDDGDYATPENQLKGSLQARYFEVVMTNTADDNWGWVRGAANYRTPVELIRNLIDSTSKGGNFVLNVGPTADGDFPPEHVQTLETIGAWMAVNGEAIYATVPAPEVRATADDGVVAYTTRTRAGEAAFVHVISWPRDGGRLKVRVDGKSKIAARLLDPSLGDAPHEITADGDSSVVSIEPPPHKDPLATVIKLTLTR